MARRKYDYSQYEHSEYEKYMAQWKGYGDVSLGYFNNDVYYRPDGKRFFVVVDDYHEAAYMDELYEEMEGPMSGEEREREHEETRADPDEQKKEIAEVLGKYQGVFDIEMDDTVPEPDHAEDPLNFFSGTRIAIPLGEGILNFCYADFSKALEKAKPLYYLLTEDFSKAVRGEVPELKDNEVISAYRDIFGKTGSESPSGQKPEPIRNRTEEIIRIYEQYTNTISVLSSVFYCSLYTAVFPPVFLRQTVKALDYYTNYIKLLQSEFLELIEFCFDESFYPEALGGLNPAERYGLYCHIKDIPIAHSRTERFFVGLRTSGEKLPCGMTAEEFIERVNRNMMLTGEQRAFAEKYGLDPEHMEHRYRIPLFISTAYECSTVRDMLYLEFTKMLEQNIRFRKCRRCGRYFIMKGNYPGEYCDRVAEGETRTCQQLAAQDKYKTKLKDNGAWGAYGKYYKRYFARAKAGAIKQPAFKQWQYAAVARRDECAEGRLPLEEYLSWLEGSFPNRGKKK